MDFETLKVKNLDHTIRFSTKMRHWVTKNRVNHILGIKLDGDALHDFGYQKFHLAENCIYFFNQKDDYTVEVLEEGTAFSVHFTTYEPISTDSFCIHLNSTAEAIRLFEKIELYAASPSGNSHLALSYFHRLCALFAEQYRKVYHPADPRITVAKEYLDLHFREENCLEQAAAVCNLSRRRFNELFRLQFNTTPNRYLTVQKIETAKQLFREEPLSVSEIAERSGFSDIFYFSKVFRSETGMTPTEYRKRYSE